MNINMETSKPAIITVENYDDYGKLIFTEYEITLFDNSLCFATYEAAERYINDPKNF